MQNTLLGAGLGCVIGAVIGGGLKGFGMEIPLINSIRRQALLGVLGFVLIGLSFAAANPSDARPALDPVSAATPARSLPHFVDGTWTLRNAVDRTGTDWSDSTLKFESQAETPDGLAVKGSFTWRQGPTLIGTEVFSGQYIVANRQLVLEGASVSNANESADRLAVGSYGAVLSADERSLVDGRWGSTMTSQAGDPGKWEATR
jgi:hypothetical protein